MIALRVAAAIYLALGIGFGAGAVVTSPLAFILGVGFALPFLLVGLPLRLGLTRAGRGSLR